VVSEIVELRNSDSLSYPPSWVLDSGIFKDFHPWRPSSFTSKIEACSSDTK
jgi:hypothetical protein